MILRVGKVIRGDDERRKKKERRKIDEIEIIDLEGVKGVRIEDEDRKNKGMVRMISMNEKEDIEKS